MNSDTPRTDNQHGAVSQLDHPVQRLAFICKYCECVYANAPVTSCDCLGHLNGEAPHFIEGEIIYPLSNASDAKLREAMQKLQEDLWQRALGWATTNAQCERELIEASKNIGEILKNKQ